MRKQNSIVRILILVFAVLIFITIIAEVVYFVLKRNDLKAIALQPEFTETSLEVGTQYTFSIKTTPGKASIKKAKCVVDDPTSSFELNDNGKAVLTTGMNEGNVTVYIECKDVKSQVLTFAVVDSVARAQAEAAAQAEAQKAEQEAEAAAAEAEAAAAEVKTYVKSTGDDVNVRSTNSTDGDVLGKAKKGDVFEKVEDVDDWTHIKYKDQDGYMKTEFLTEISEEEFQEGATSSDGEEEKKEEEKKDEKKEEKKQEDQPAEESPEEQTGNTQTKEEAEAKAAADAAKAAEDAAKAAADAAAAAAAAGGHEYGGHVFTNDEWNCLLNVWAYTGDAAEMISHHSAAELKAVLDEKMSGGARSAW